MHLPAIITDLAMILGVAALVTLLFQKIRQPVVLGYIVAGVILGPYTPTGLYVTDLPNIKVWAELGVIFLMFSLGLEFTFHKLISVGRPAAGTAITEVLLMLGLGYSAGKLLGWPHLDSLFLGGMLSISSTTIIIKAFDELGLKSRRFAEIVFGVLIVEDLVAILLLVALSTVAATQTFFSVELLLAALKLVLIVGSWFLIGYFFIPSFLRYAGRHLRGETLTVLSTGLCLSLVVVATDFNYSAALGAFIMGSILAETNQAHRIEELVQPLRDLFAAVFFVSVGMLVDPSVVLRNWVPVVVITVVTIVGKMASSSLGALLSGQSVKRSVQIGFSLAQIGEFSFIIATLGSTLRVTSDFLYPIAVAVSVITTFTTPYLIRLSEPFASAVERNLPSNIKRGLASYAAWSQAPRGDTALRQAGRVRLLRFVLNAILVTLIFLGVADFATPWLARFLPGGMWLQLGGFCLAVAGAAPFVWGMFTSFTPGASDRQTLLSEPGFVVALAQLVTVLWLGALSSVFFSALGTLAFTLSAAGVVFFTLYRRLGRSYRWFEKRFLATFEQNRVPEPSLLAPWDLGLTRLVVHANSALVGKTIGDSRIRTRYGLNVVAIERGGLTIPAPQAKDAIFPQDVLLVLGTDDQIDPFRHEAESPVTQRAHPEAHDYTLKKILLLSDSPYAGKSIRDSGLRSALKGLVVGLERGTLRTVNPDPATTLHPGDILWVACGLDATQ